MRRLGVDPALVEPISLLLLSLLVPVAAVLLLWLTKRAMIRTLERIIARTTASWDDILVRRRVFRWLAHIVPATFLYLTGPAVLAEYPLAAAAARRLAQIYLLVAGVLSLDAAVDSFREIAQSWSVTRTLPLRSFVQVFKIMLYFVAAILVLSSILGKSPAILIGGMGALAAVLMLVFRDPILGFVSGVQLTANDMVHVGDWIEVPKHGADGTVVDISLTTIKVQNWDKTITSVPTYGLVSDSFVNWRGMTDAGGRRIKRAVHIDMTSVRFCDEEMLEKFSRYASIRDYIARKRREITEYNARHAVDESVLLNGRRMTNIGTFRAYLLEYLRRHPMIRQDMTLLVRQLDPTDRGLPLEVYAFSSDTAWANYEGIQADIFDHILSALPQFDLRVFQNPTGADFRRLGT